MSLSYSYAVCYVHRIMIYSYHPYNSIVMILVGIVLLCGRYLVYYSLPYPLLVVCMLSILFICSSIPYSSTYTFILSCSLLHCYGMYLIIVVYQLLWLTLYNFITYLSCISCIIYYYLYCISHSSGLVINYTYLTCVPYLYTVLSSITSQH